MDLAAKIAGRLLQQFGARDLGLVEQVDRTLFRAALSDGRYVMAGAGENGEIWVKELEASP